MRSLSWRRTFFGARLDPCATGFSVGPALVFSADDEAGCDGVGPSPAGGMLTTAGAVGDALGNAAFLALSYLAVRELKVRE